LTNAFLRGIISTSNDLIWNDMPTHYSGSPKEVLALDTYIKLTRAANGLLNHVANSDVLGNLTISQFGVLETLLHLGPLSQSVICNKLLKSGGNITLVIDNLEKNGLVQRQSDPHDRRISIVSLTPAGDELIREVFPKVMHLIVAEFATLSSAEQAELGQLCKKLGKRESIHVR
jgi:MarR family 2-MHQ and catechol resistance regulon transcriptional repressor